MAREHLRIVGQGEQFRVNAAGKLLEAAAGKVGPPDAAGEQHVAAEDHDRLALAPDEDHVSGRMAGNLAHLEIESRGLIAIAFAHQHVGRRADQIGAEGARQIERRVGQLCGVAVANDDRTLGITFFDAAIAGDVVAVPMRDQDGGRR